MARSAFAYDTVTLKMKVTNPSDTETKTLPVKINLPLGIAPEDLVNKGGFNIDYDVDTSRYFALANVTLAPGQTAPMELEMKDIWTVPSTQISSLKMHAQQDMQALSKSSYSRQSQSLAEGIIKRLDQITASQKALQGRDPQERISAYDTNSALLKDVTKDLNAMDDLLIETNPSAAGRIIARESPYAKTPVPLEADLSADRPEVINFEISASNPSDTQDSVSLKYYLPSELKPGDILDSADLKVGYDYQKDEHYVYSKEVLLGPHESRKYVIAVKDVWRIPERQIGILRGHTQKLMKLLAATEFKDMAKAMGDKILIGLNDILKSQNDRQTSVAMHIGNNRQNLKKLEDIRSDIAGLDNLFTRAGGSIGDLMKNDAPLAGARGAELIGKSIFRGKAPDTATSWKIIYIILSFLGVVSLGFIMMQVSWSRGYLFDPMTGAFRREHLPAKLKQQFLLCGKATAKCSVMLLDINHFKHFNDTYGHPFGDRILREYFSILRSALRQTDPVFRYGGDEFVVILPFVDRNTADAIAGKIMNAFKGRQVRHGNDLVNISTSVGIAVYPDDGKLPEEVIERAHKDMYKSRTGGKKEAGV